MNAAVVNLWLVFAIPAVMVLFGGITKGLIAGFTVEAFALGLESTLVALTECFNRIRVAQGLPPKEAATITLIGVLMLLLCIVVLGILIAIHRGMRAAAERAIVGPGSERPASVRRWYTSPWLWLVGVGNMLGAASLVGVLYLMMER